MSAADAAPGPAVARVRTVVFALLAALLALLAAWHLRSYAAGTAVVGLALAFAPWLATLGGLRAGRRRTYAVASLLTIPYLGYGLMEVIANPGARAWAGATVFLAFALFVALVAFLRVSRPSPAPSARTAP